MNKFEYKDAYTDIAPSEELIQNTLLKIKKQKQNEKIIIKIRTYLQIAVAACFCVAVGISSSKFTGLNINKDPFVGSIFGTGSVWVLAVLLFVLITTGIIIINKRRK